ncbi:hypothetical protein WICPIJ_007697 [Wickerhamomyces pijperi]|uniref:Uncharacterized protein n=1 Tax=Wickerhamomyces pijperi TaxID=599730 RepID=A0A9P8Q216_WICPI|nr:hypothetical protein WICPIJ_007697 [Wickerhamomyces pijperi]
MSNITDQINLADLIQPTNLEPSAFEQSLQDEGYEYDYTSSEYDTDDEIEHSINLKNAQLQWEQSVQQIKTLVGLVILPLIGKVLGRRVAGFLWRKAFDYFY